MDTQTASTPAATPAAVATIFLALDLSRSSWLVAIPTPVADKVSRHKLAAGDIDALLALIARLRAAVEQQTGCCVRVLSCYEAGYDGFWLHRRLAAAGVTNHVIDPASLQLDRRARRVKTDAVDVDALLRALTAFCRGERRALRPGLLDPQTARHPDRLPDPNRSPGRTGRWAHLGQGGGRAPRHLDLSGSGLGAARRSAVRSTLHAINAAQDRSCGVS